MGDGFCQQAGCGGALESDDAVGSVCTLCGTVSRGSSSSGFQSLDRLTEPDSGAQPGRQHLHDGGTGYAGSRQSLAVAGSVGHRERYRDQKQAEVEMAVKNLLASFDLAHLAQHAQNHFDAVKIKLSIKWGKKSKVVAAACCYLAARQADKLLPLIDIAAKDNLDYSKLVRAQNAVKVALDIKTSEIDPAVFVDRLLNRFASFFPPATAKDGTTRVVVSDKVSAWKPNNIAYAKAISFELVKKVCISLLSLTNSINLFAGRNAAQVACAAVLVAIEAVARKKIPSQRDFLLELAHFMAVSTFTIGERYREIVKAIDDWTTQVPWLAGASTAPQATGSSRKRASGFANWEQVINFTLAARPKPTVLEPIIKLEAEEKADVPEEEEEDDDDQFDFVDDQLNPDSPAPADRSRSLSPSAWIKPSPSTPLALLPVNEHSNGSSLSAALDARQAAKRSKRPAAYIRQRPGDAKRLRTIEAAASTLRVTLSPESEQSDLPSTPPDYPALRRAPSAKPAATNALGFLAHAPESVAIRRQLLAGNAPIAVFDNKHNDEPLPFGRLARLLFTRKEADIPDDDLFDAGELEGYIRSQEQRDMLAQSKHFLEIPDWNPDAPSRPPRSKKSKEAQAASTASLLFGKKTKVSDEARARLGFLFDDDDSATTSGAEMDIEEMDALGEIAHENEVKDEDGEDDDSDHHNDDD